jgi:hypothetical protein
MRSKAMIVAEKCLSLLLRRFHHECIALNGKRPLPEELDDLTLGGLLLVSDYCDKLKGSKVLEEIEKCILAIEFFPQGYELTPLLKELIYYDQMPFRIAHTLLQKQRLPLRDGVEHIKRAVAHHDSGLRWYFYRVCWMVRRHLPKEKFLDPLFKCISDCLGYVDHAAGLASALCDDRQDFFVQAEEFEPNPRFLDQYQERIKNLRENESFLSECQRPFESLELKLRRQIADVAMNLELGQHLEQQSLFRESDDRNET